MEIVFIINIHIIISKMKLELTMDVIDIVRNKINIGGTVDLMNIDKLDSVQVGIFMRNVRRSTLIQDKDINNVMSIDSVQKVKAKEGVD